MIKKHEILGDKNILVVNPSITQSISSSKLKYQYLLHQWASFQILDIFTEKKTWSIRGKKNVNTFGNIYNNISLTSFLQWLIDIYLH